MSYRIINVFLMVNIITIGLAAGFPEGYESEDVGKNEDFNLLQMLKNYVERHREHRREAGDFSEDWPGRWMPERPSDPKPPPKIFHKSEDWPGRWMPERPSDPKPPPKIFHKSEDWPGRWMPERPSDPKPPPKIFHKSEIEKQSIGSRDMHRIPMGVKSVDCDDGKTNLTVDWDHSPVNHTCYGPKITPEYEINPHLYCEHIPAKYVAVHKCMQDVIEYDEPIPLYGTHRPIWPIYGEYKFVPRQRWLHNLEHGGVVMLYHPCANPLEVKRLKTLVTGCVRRHIITPSNLLGMERPLALITWGCRLTMSYVDPELVQQFIMEKGLQGPEEIEFDGDFEDGLLKKAEIVSDIKDSKLCPNSRVPRNQVDSDGKSM